jgi:hypothetical protein
MMRWTATAALAGLAEIAAHFLSAGWGMGVLLIAFIWLSGLLRTAAVKGADTEKRVNALVPQVGAIRDTADSALSTANGKVSKSGDTITGSLTVNGDHHVGGNLYGAGGQLAVGDTTTIWGDCGIHGFEVITGTLSQHGGNTMPVGAPGTSLSTLSDCINCCVAIIRTLQGCEIFA